MPASSSIARILVLAPNWIGDAAMATPALRALRTRHGEAHITVAARAPICALLEGLPAVDEVFPLPKRPGAAALWRLAEQLRPRGYGLCVVFPHSFRAALIARMTGAGIRVAYARGHRSWLLTHAPAPYREDGRIVPIYMAREYLALVAALGCQDDGNGLELHADEEDLAAVAERLGPGGPIVGLAPGAAFGPSKQWPAERYAAVADALAVRIGARCVLITGPGEEDTREAVIRAAKSPLIELQTEPSSIARLKAIIASLDLLIANDSGPRHIAIAFKKPVICVMGPTSPRYTESPWERGKVLRVDVDCGPCQKPVCTTDHRCMTQITPEQVAEAALKQLALA